MKRLSNFFNPHNYKTDKCRINLLCLETFLYVFNRVLFLNKAEKYYSCFLSIENQAGITPKEVGTIVIYNQTKGAILKIFPKRSLKGK